MTKREIAALAVKLIAVFLLASRVGSLPLLIRGLTDIARIGDAARGVQLTVISSLVSFALTVGVYLWMILRGDAIAAVIVSSGGAIERIDAISKRDLQIVAFSSIGLVVVAEAVPRAAELALTYLALVTPIPRPLRSPTHLSTELLTTVVQLGFGLYLLVSAPGLVGLVNRFANQDH